MLVIRVIACYYRRIIAATLLFFVMHQFFQNYLRSISIFHFISN